MTNTRDIACDALFTILYIGLTAAMACFTVALVIVAALNLVTGASLLAGAFLNLAGWVALPFMPVIYDALMGRRFSWSENSVLGSAAEG